MSLISWMARLSAASAILAVFLGCASDDNSGLDTESEVDSAGDADGDSDTDSDGDTDSDTDTDTYTDTDSDGDSDSDADADSDSDADADSDSDTDTDTDADADRDQGWELVWQDEFDGSSIDTSKWEHEVNCWGGGNNEQQCYVADAKNSFVRDGILHIVAIADSPSGEVNPPEDTNITTLPYSSARLRTRDRGDWKYGRIEARLQLPDQQGLWPAFWMLPTDSVYGGWAASGEIDIMEAVNLSPDENVVYGTLHYGGGWPANVHSGSSVSPDGYVAEAFHTYAIEWEAGEIRWFVDDAQYAVQTEWYTDTEADFPAPFDQRFHVLLNVAVGGAWPGPPDGDTAFPKEMLVDYVRVYQCAADPETGHGCGD